jgi:hypothetical protein
LGIGFPVGVFFEHININKERGNAENLLIFKDYPSHRYGLILPKIRVLGNQIYTPKTAYLWSAGV